MARSDLPELPAAADRNAVIAMTNDGQSNFCAEVLEGGTWWPRVREKGFPTFGGIVAEAEMQMNSSVFGGTAFFLLIARLIMRANLKG